MKGLDAVLPTPPHPAGRPLLARRSKSLYAYAPGWGRCGRILTVVLAAAIAFFCFGFGAQAAWAEAPPADAKPPEPAADSDLPPRPEAASPTVVTIDPEIIATLTKKSPEGVADLKRIEQQVRKVTAQVLPCTVGVQIGSSAGSGVIISPDGYVLTAGHVSGKANVDVTFILHDGRRVTGRTLGINHSIDSGLMKISGDGPWPYAACEQDNNLKAGQWCVAMGHPGGYVDGRPPVVRLGRVLNATNEVIRTDCTLVGGDSGGPLFNMEGKVVGIHSRIGWQTTTNFHVPIKTYHDTWKRLALAETWGNKFDDGDGFIRPMLGVTGEAAGKECRIKQVFPNYPAEQAGIKAGDIVETFAGQKVGNFADLARLVLAQEPGAKIAVELRRGEAKMQLEVVLAPRHGPLPGGPKD